MLVLSKSHTSKWEYGSLTSGGQFPCVLSMVPRGSWFKGEWFISGLFSSESCFFAAPEVCFTLSSLPRVGVLGPLESDAGSDISFSSLCTEGIWDKTHSIVYKKMLRKWLFWKKKCIFVNWTVRYFPTLNILLKDKLSCRKMVKLLADCEKETQDSCHR